jgi:Ubiquitin fusion degradation protein UFD1
VSILSADQAQLGTRDGYWEQLQVVDCVSETEELTLVQGHKLILPSSSLSAFTNRLDDGRRLFEQVLERARTPGGVQAQLGPSALVYEVCARNGKPTYCGVQEFTASPHQVRVPRCVQELCGVEARSPGASSSRSSRVCTPAAVSSEFSPPSASPSAPASTCSLTSATAPSASTAHSADCAAQRSTLSIRQVWLPAATFVRFHVSAPFDAVVRPRAVLEWALHGRVALSLGDQLALSQHQCDYTLTVVEVAPAPAVSIVNVDLEVEFSFMAESAQEPAPLPEKSFRLRTSGTSVDAPDAPPLARALRPLDVHNKTEGEEYTRCATCRHNVPARNAALHQARCARYYFFCALCEKAVPLHRRDLHERTEHAPQTCAQCHQRIAHGRMETHLREECTQCLYCELPVALTDLDAHHAVCGCKTDRCEVCSAQVLRRGGCGEPACDMEECCVLCCVLFACVISHAFTSTLLTHTHYNCLSFTHTL